MVSRTKYHVDDATIRRMFEKAGIGDVTAISPLGNGEYNAVYEVTADRQYVLKIAPGNSSYSLTYEKDMMRSETFWYSLIRERTDIRVPEVYFTDFSGEIIPPNWFIMEKMDGVERNKLKMTSREKRRSVERTAEMAAAIHSVRGEAFGYIQNDLHPDWYEALGSMVKNLLADAEKKGRRSRRGERLEYFIDKHREILMRVDCRMVNFDIWDPNIICSRDDGDIRYAWIDPERSFWGDRICDFCCLEMMYPLDKKLVSLQAYNAVADEPVEAGHEERLRYAMAQALMGLIMETEKYYRYTPRHFGWWRNVFASAFFFSQAFRVLKNE